MEKEEMTIKGLADQQYIVVDYSDEDVIIIDSIKQLAEPSVTRIKMNLITVATKGKAQVNVNGQNMTFGESQLLLCPPNTTLTDFMFSPDFEFNAMFLSNRIIQSFLRDKVNIWNEMMYIHKMHVVTLDPRDVKFFSYFHDALDMVIKAPTDHYIYRTEVIQGLVSSVLLGLCGAVKATMPGSDKSGKTQADSLFHRFLDMVNSNNDKNRTVEDYASVLCVSPKYLSVICKKASGKTANEWIREHMLEEIRYYLKQTDLSMKQVADKLGFANPSFFGRYVKEHFGMTPMQFRQK